ncbi:cytochrome P450 [Streptomyces carminius]|uniref:cytochrome P450 n=1 Tax=Streptomyces carminius TaxID=2665496 RepID=UPI001E4FDA57|nr:cytochrome P450 [Streptomyces carminius]
MTATPRRPLPAEPPAGAPPRCPAGRSPAPLYGPGLDGDNLPELYARLRARYGPVAPVSLAPGVYAWLVMGYREVLRLARDERNFSHDPRLWNLPREGRVPSDSPVLAFLGWRPALMFADGRAHRRLRSAVADTLTGIDGRELVRMVRNMAGRLVDSFGEAREVDLVPRYAHRLPALVLARLLGTDDRTGRQLAEAVTGAAAANADSGNAARRMERVLLSLIGHRRRRPGPDAVSRLLAHPAALTEEEVLHNLMVTAVAGYQPTKNWLATSVRTLLTDHSLRSSLDSGLLTLDDVLETVLWRSPPTQNLPARYATRDLCLGGQEVRAGDMLVLALAAANGDPEAVPPRDVPAAGNRGHVSFGAGPHTCPAREQARLIVRTAVEVLWHRRPGMELAVPEEDLVWWTSPWTKGLAALPVRFTAPRTVAVPAPPTLPGPAAGARTPPPPVP